MHAKINKLKKKKTHSIYSLAEEPKEIAIPISPDIMFFINVFLDQAEL